MICYDYECQQCGYIWESMAAVDEEVIPCVNPRCGGTAKRLIGVSCVHTANQDSAWIRSVREVVEKDSGKRHCEEFLKNPTRKNYQTWMKKENLRHRELGESRDIKESKQREEKEYLNKMTNTLMRMKQKRESLSLRN